MSDLLYKRVNRQYVAMSQDEVWQFIRSQKVMFVGFLDDGGYPHVTPVWHVCLDGTICFRATSNKVKAKVADGARVCCTLADGERFTELRGVVVRGRSEVLADAARVVRREQLLDEKYTGLRSRDLGVPAPWLAARDREASLMIEVTPERISSWDNSKLGEWRAEERLQEDPRT